MKMHRSFVPLVTALVLFLFLISPTETFARDEWIKVRSKNFYLVGNAPEKEVRRVATRLEQFRVVFSNLFPSMKFNSPIPTTVIVFKSDKAFTPYKPLNAKGKANEWVAGYFQPSEDINYITLTTEREADETYRTIYHEYVHFLVDNTLGKANVPPWFNEGLAEYYERFKIEDDQKVTLGSINENSLDLLASSKLIPLETFFDIDYMNLHAQGNHGANIFYAQAWALMHYLIQGNKGARASQLGRFLNLKEKKGVTTKQAFEQVFQTTYAAMEAELRKYIAQRSFFVSVANFPQKLLFDADMTTTPMPEAEAKATLGDLLSHSRRLEDAEAHLNEALALDPESPAANSSMGYIKMRQRKFDESRKYLEKAVAIDQKNYMVYFRYAYALSREFVDSNNMIRSYSPDVATKMKTALTKSVALNPGYPESYSLLAMISMVRNENLEEGIANLQKALSLSPGNQHYQMNLAGMYMNARQFDKAQPIVEGLIASADDPGTRAQAQNMLSALNSMKEFAERVKNSGGTMGPGKVMIVDEENPPTEEEVKKMQAEAEYEAVAGALREPKPGEVRVFGHLTKIECTAGAITYTVREGSNVFKLQSKDFQGINFMAYGPVVEREIGCGSVKQEFYAILTYVSRENPKLKTKGELVSVEVVPEGWKLKQ